MNKFKKMSANMFLLSVLAALIMLPIGSIKFSKVNVSENVLATEDVRVESLEKDLEIKNQAIILLQEELAKIRQECQKETR